MNKITITIDCGDDSFHNPSPASSVVAGLLREIAVEFEQGNVPDKCEKPIIEINGNTCGKLKVS